MAKSDVAAPTPTCPSDGAYKPPTVESAPSQWIDHTTTELQREGRGFQYLRPARFFVETGMEMQGILSLLRGFVAGQFQKGLRYFR